MSRTKSNIPKSERGGYELWSRRPLAGYSHNSQNKRLCRRIERSRKRREIEVELKLDEVCGWKIKI